METKTADCWSFWKWSFTTCYHSQDKDGSSVVSHVGLWSPVLKIRDELLCSRHLGALRLNVAHAHWSVSLIFLSDTQNEFNILSSTAWKPISSSGVFTQVPREGYCNHIYCSLVAFKKNFVQTQRLHPSLKLCAYHSCQSSCCSGFENPQIFTPNSQYE